MTIILRIASLLLVSLMPPALAAEVTWVAVRPSATDPRIHAFDTPHWG